MQVIISSGGVYHAYHAARGAAQAGVLKRFITGIYLKHETGIPPSLYRKILLPNYIGHAIQQIPGSHSQYISYLIRDNLFDWAASQMLADCDIFHGWNHMSLFTMRRAKRQGARTVIERSSAHPVWLDGMLRDEYRRHGLSFPAANRWLNRKHIQEYEEADAIFVCSDFVWRTMVENGVPPHKLRKVTLGFDPSKFHPIPDSKPGNVFRIMFCGAVSLQKGVQYLLEAFKQLHLPNAELLLVGGLFPDSRSFLPNYRGLYRHVPYLPHDQLTQLYSSSSVFVLPSLQDGFGMVVYEAAACGLPVIVSQNVGAPIRDGQDGFIVPIRDPNALADRLLQLYKDEPLRHTMGESIRQYVQQFTWEHYHQQLIGHYRELMG